MQNRHRPNREIPALIICISAAMVQGQATRPAEPGNDRPAVRSLFDLVPAALEGPLVTDRPDFTESVDAVPRGHLQLESGYTFSHDREQRHRTLAHTAPELLYRLGLWEDFELRLGWAGYTWAENLSDTRTRQGRRVAREEWDRGAEDMILGFKRRFCEQVGWRPALGLIAETSLPTGGSDNSSGDVDPGIKLLWSYELSSTWSVAGNINLATPTEQSHRFAQSAASISLAKSWTDRVGSYFEYFGLYPNQPHADCAHYVNGGMTFLVTDNLQIDVRVGHGLNEEADDFFSGVGVSFRL